MKKITTALSVIALGMFSHVPAFAQTSDPCDNYAVGQCGGQGYAEKGYYTYQNCYFYYFYSCQNASGDDNGNDGCGHIRQPDPCQHVN